MDTVKVKRIVSEVISLLKSRDKTPKDKADTGIKLLSQVIEEIDGVSDQSDPSTPGPGKKRKESSPTTATGGGVDSDHMELDNPNQQATLNDVLFYIRQTHAESCAQRKEILDSVSRPAQNTYSSAASSNADANAQTRPARQTNSISYNSSPLIAMVVRKKEGDTQHTGTTIKTSLRTLQCIKEAKVGVVSVAKSDHLLLKVRSQLEQNIISQELISLGHTIEPLSPKLPQVKVLNVDATMGIDEFERYLKSDLNPNFQHDDVKVVGIRRSRDPNTKTMIIRVPVEVAKKVPARGGRVFISHESLIVTLDDMLVQCWNCRAYGHMSKTCPAESRRGKTDTLCPKCGEIHDRSLQCETVCCSNCKRENERNRYAPGSKNAYKTNHSSDNYRVCSVALRIRRILRENIYGEE